MEGETPTFEKDEGAEGALDQARKSTRDDQCDRQGVR